METNVRSLGAGPDFLYGCLTGSGLSAPVAGHYRYCRRGLATPFPPDLTAGGESGDVPFATGRLTGGEAAPIGWKGASLGQVGADIVIDLGGVYFVDRVILHQADPNTLDAGPRHDPLTADASTPVASRPRSIVPWGLSHVAVYTRESDGAAAQLAARVGTANQASPLSEVDVTAVVGVPARELTVRISADNRDVLLAGIEVWGAAAAQPALYPLPQRLTLLDGTPLVLADVQAIAVAAAACDETLAAAAALSESLAGRGGLALPVVRGAATAGPLLRVGTPGELGPEAVAGMSEPGPEGYRLCLTAEGALVVGATLRGLLYGVEALAQLLAAEGGAPACIVEDEPYTALRGVHLYLPHRKDIDFYKRLMRHVLLPMRYNTIFIELAGAMRYDRHPEIAEAWERTNRLAAEGKVLPIPHCENGGGSYLTKDEVAGIVRYGERLGFEVIPEVQSLSHVEYLTQVYPEIAEDPSATYPDSYCPHHPLSHRLVFDMIDEAIEVFRPKRYVHMGHDEVYTMAKDERCRDGGRAQAFAYDVHRLYDYLRSKGLGMIIWGDMIQDFQPYGAPEAIDVIPKDILLLDFVWYFRPGEDIEDRLLEHGFTVGMGNLYSSHYPRFSARIAKPDMVGGEVSTWGYANEADLGRRGKLYDFVYTANMLWSRHYREELRVALDRKVAQLLAGMRDHLSGSAYPSRRPDATFMPLALPVEGLVPRRDHDGGLGGYDLTSLPRGEATLSGVPFALADCVLAVRGSTDGARPSSLAAPIAIGGRADSFVLLLTASTNAALGNRIGTCRLVYADGSVEETRLLYGWQVAEWNRRHGAPLAHGAFRHFGYVGTYPSLPFWQGKTPQGEDVTVYGLELVNPHPEKDLRGLALVPGETDAMLLLAAATAVRAR
ncbi:MAG: family 20 glycosylhydrolase [Anaerolineae bacterium]